MNFTGTNLLKQATIACLLLLWSGALHAQLPNCNATSPIIYIVANGNIYNYDPNQPWNATNPVLNTIPSAGAYSLAVSPNINGPGPSPTFYQVAGANYSYWDGTQWVNTGHTAGAVNPGAGAGFIYSLIGGTGDVYKYDGTGNATLLTTIPNFQSGPYDLCVDCAGNFYALRTNPQSAAALLQYDPNGNLINSWTLNGPPTVYNGGGGLAFWNNEIYFTNPAGIWKGVVSGSSVNCTLHVPQTTVNYLIQDFGTCPLKTAGTSSVQANVDTVYYCGTGPAIPIGIAAASGVTSCTWSVLNGPATIYGSGNSITVTATATAQILMEATISNACGTVSGKDTVTIVVPKATLDAGANDTFYGCGQYIDTLRGYISNNQNWLKYNFDWTPAPYVQTGGNTLKPTVLAPGDTWFFLTATTDPDKGGCTWKDSVFITTTDAQVDAKFGTEIYLGCDQDTVIFLDSSTTKLTALKYKWIYNDNGAFDSIKAARHIYKKQNFYTVILYIDNGYCKDTATATVDLNHPLHALYSFDDTRVCQRDTIQFDATGSIISLPLDPQKYYWDFGDGSKDSVKSPRHAFRDAMAYPVSLIVYDSLGCTDTVTHLIDNIIPLPTIQLGPQDTVVCKGEKLYLPTGISAHGDKWLWYDGSQEPRKIISKSGRYTVQLYNECGYGADTITVTFKDCSLFFPNAFSPNGDGKNDIAHILGNTKDVTSCELAIYNRWGEKMFYTTSKEEGWDGTFKGEPQDMGTYYYIVKYEILGEPYEMKGDFVLVR